MDRHIILRLSWVVGALGRNLLTNLLLPITAESEGYINAERRGSPVGHSDVARVINAIVKQVASGSANWGIFHYSSGDVCTEEEFAQELLARLEEKSIETGPIVDASGGHSEPLSAALGYRRLMDCFGIQPRTWRQGLKIELDRWLKECSTISKSVSKQSS